MAWEPVWEYAPSHYESNHMVSEHSHCNHNASSKITYYCGCLQSHCYLGYTYLFAVGSLIKCVNLKDSGTVL